MQAGDDAGMFIADVRIGNVSDTNFHSGEGDGNTTYIPKEERKLTSEDNFPGNFGLYLAVIIFCMIIIGVPMGLIAYRRKLLMAESKRMKRLATIRIPRGNYVSPQDVVFLKEQTQLI
ncbi:uncharacterized protein LOC120344785 [Styela clava]|uniref:uncharacterized protein LOC120344785 n=1 Tax=Styela clava TaxID=7725 RepID=UPI001939A824|nr:uncharacterized protein LOC120344785 [Styela clava]